MTQLAINLAYRPALGRADFLVSDCNRAAFEAIERWPDWQQTRLVLCGPPGSGKSHLAHLWQERSGGALVAGDALHQGSPDALARLPGVAVDDAERAPEQALLHLYNCCSEAGTSLLIIARTLPAAWPIVLPDLASRLRAAPCVSIAPPDDALLAAVLVKHFADRGLRVPPSVIGFLVRRIERSFAAAATIAVRLDRLALDAGRPIGLALARRALAEIADQS
ncbi:MAG TPA: DNA replication protein [Stellaceae bacterium]|nr:DNA replication protein [Stellaceae bacterium]